MFQYTYYEKILFIKHKNLIKYISLLINNKKTQIT